MARDNNWIINTSQVNSNAIVDLPQDPNELGFGKYFTPHMFLAFYTQDKGWHDFKIVPFGNLSLSPAALGLHYGQLIFEGVKYYIAGENAYLFRHRDHAKRFNDSARICLMQEPPEEVTINALELLTSIDGKWIPPRETGASGYLRPFMIATESALGVRPSNKYLFCIITSPSGPYFPEGFKPIDLLIEKYYARAPRGGLGLAKAAANYANSLVAFPKMREHGCKQTIYLDPEQHRNIEETGAMSLAMNINGDFVTPEQTDTILPGITLDSAITIMENDLNKKVVRRIVTLEEFLDRVSDNSLSELFGLGTAVIVGPVGNVYYKGKRIQIGDGQPGEMAKMLYSQITGVHQGRIDDKYNWLHKVNLKK